MRIPSPAIPSPRVLSLPGERIGYVAVRPGCEGEEVLVDVMAQISRFTGHNCPPSLIQRACAECLEVTSELSVYETNMAAAVPKTDRAGLYGTKAGRHFLYFPQGAGAGRQRLLPEGAGI